MDFKKRWSAASPRRAPVSWTVTVCLVMCAGLHVEANDTVPSTGILSTESPQASSFDTSSKAPRSDVPSKESTVNIAVTVSTTEHYTASQSSTTLLSTSFTKHTTLPTQTSKNAATDTMSQTVSSVSAASPTTKTEQPTSAESPTTNTEQPTSAESPTTKTGQPVSAEAPITKPEEPTSAESPATKTEQPTSAESPATNSSLSSSTVPSSATAANKTEASTEHSGNTTNAGSTTADINSTNVNTGSPLPASSQSSEKPDGPSTTGVENTATSATNLDSQKSAVVEPPATKPPSTVGTPISTEEQRALSPGSVAAITIIVIAIVLVIFGGVAFWKIRSSSYGRLLEDQDYGSLGNYNNPLYDDS